MDLVLYAGPVILREAFRRIDWHGRDVRIVPIVHEDSSYFSSLAEQLRDGQGRILPALVRRYAGVELSQVDQIALAAYSAGHGLLNKVGAVPADRERLSAMLLHDATFSGFNDAPKAGYVAMGLRAMSGDALLVSTTSNSGGANYLTGRKSWLLIWSELQRLSGRGPQRISPPGSVPAASGGWWRLGGNLNWGNYAVPGAADGQGNDLAHGQHNDLAAAVWSGFLAPWFARPRWIGPLLAGAAVAGLGLGGYLWWRGQKTQ